MVRILLAVAAFFWLAAPVSAQETRTFTQSIFFETGSDALDEAARTALNGLVASLQESPDFDLKIEAFTDDRGSEQFNTALAERRAASAAQFLTALEVQPRSTSVKNFGESRQTQAGDDLEETRRFNRRVDIVATTYLFNDLAALFQRLDPGQNDGVFRFSASFEEQHFTTPRGTQVTLPGDAFEFEDGSTPGGTIEFRIREAYDPSTWFANRLATQTSDGKLLQTAGMVFTEASSEGRALRLREDRKITLAVPFEGERDADMRLFYGEQHQLEGDTTAQDFSQSETTWRAVPDGVLRNSMARSQKFVSAKLPVGVADFLKKLKFETPEKPDEPQFVDELKYPTPPVLPAEPVFYGKKPERKDFVFKPSTVWERFKSAEKRRVIEEQRYQKAFEQYQKALVVHERRVAEYEKKIASRQAEIDAFEAARVHWRGEAATRLLTYFTFKNKDRRYKSFVALNDLLANADNMKIACRNFSLSLDHLLASRAQALARVSTTSTRTVYIGLHDQVPIRPVKIAEPSKSAESHFREDLRTAYYLIRQEVPNHDGELENLLRDTPGFPEAARDAQEQAMQRCIETGDVATLRSYVFDLTQTGWCNLDKFAQFDAAQALALEVKEPGDAMLTVMLPSINAAINMAPMQNGRYISSLKIPKGQRARIIALKVKDGMAQLAVHEFVVGREKTPELVYRKMSVAALRKELEKLNA